MRSTFSVLLLVLSSAVAPQAAAGVNRWTPMGPEGAPIRALAPSAAQQGLIYAVTGERSTSESPERAVFCSLDGGRSWEPRAFEVPVELVEGLVADPLDASRLYLVGRPLLASQDGGVTWRPLLRRGGFPLVGLAVDPNEPQRLFALHGNHRVFFSADQGASWQPRSDGLPAGAAAAVLRMNPREARTLYAAGSAGVFKTVDRGLHWAPTGLRIGTSLLAIAPSRPTTLYAYDEASSLRRTQDGGASWSVLRGPYPFDRVFSLLVHPTDPRRVLARTDAGLFESRDGGDRWEVLAENLAAWAYNPSTNELIADPFDGERLYTGLGERQVTSTNFGASWSGTHWAIARQGFSHQRVWAVATSAGSEARLYAAVSLATRATPGLWKSRNQGLSWLPRIPDETVTTTAVAIDPTNFRHVVAAGSRWHGGLRFSETHNGGERWDLLGGPDEEIRHMSFAQRDPRLVFAVSFSKLYRSADGGTQWTESTTGLPEPCDTLVCSSFHIRKVIPSPHHAQTVYLLFDGGIFRSSDGGESWEPWGGELAHSVWDLVADPTQPGRFWAATTQGVFITRDGGRHWEPRSIGLPERADLPGARQVEALALDPSAPWKLVAVSFDGRIFRSKDGGFTWRLASTGLLPGVGPLGLLADPIDPGRFYLLTAAGGLWSTSFTD